MELYLSAGTHKPDCQILVQNKVKFLLLSFYELRRWTSQDLQMIKQPEKFMLDSGAFTFMNCGREVNWKEYVNDYIKFINKWDIKYFVELDLYGILGVEKTEKIRKRLEEKTGKKPIPVYHGTMPLSYFRKLCSEYPYVAISVTGTLESSKWTRNTKVLKQVVRIGHSYGCKLHGLGFTRFGELNCPQVGFDSVDSTTWLSGARYGLWYVIKHGKIKQINKAGYGIDRLTFNNNNAKIWIELQNNLSTNL